MALHLEVWIDYNDLASFVMTKFLHRYQRCHPVNIQWRVFEQYARELAVPEKTIRHRFEHSRSRYYPDATAEGIKVNSGPQPVDSRKALIGLKFAESQGKADAYHARVMDAGWQQALDINGDVVIRSLAACVGLDREAFNAALTGSYYLEAARRDYGAAYHRQIRSVPTLSVNHGAMMMGYMSYDVLASCLENFQ